MIKATVTTPTDRTIHIERVVDAKRERVWRAMTEPDQIAQWWCRGNKLQIAKFDLRPGGHWRFVETSKQGVHGFEGRFREIDPPNGYVQTFEWDGAPGHVVIETVRLEQLPDGKTKIITTSLFHTTEERDRMLKSGMETGLDESYAALDKLLASDEPGARPFAGVRKVAFTMLPMTDVARARKFYEETLGLRPGMHGGHGDVYWLEYDLPAGGCLALFKGGPAKPTTDGACIALEVENLDATIDRLKSLGVRFLNDVVKGPNCRMSTCVDSEGNGVLLHQLNHA